MVRNWIQSRKGFQQAEFLTSFVRDKPIFKKMGLYTYFTPSGTGLLDKLLRNFSKTFSLLGYGIHLLNLNLKTLDIIDPLHVASN